MIIVGKNASVYRHKDQIHSQKDTHTSFPSVQRADEIYKRIGLKCDCERQKEKQLLKVESKVAPQNTKAKFIMHKIE